jgi:hypothetical protein
MIRTTLVVGHGRSLPQRNKRAASLTEPYRSFRESRRSQWVDATLAQIHLVRVLGADLARRV